MHTPQLFCSIACQSRWVNTTRALGDDPDALIAEALTYVPARTPDEQICLECYADLGIPDPLPAGAVFALAHPATAVAYFGFGWRVVEALPAALIIAGPAEHASWQITRLYSGGRGFGWETYPTAEAARAAIVR